MTIKTHTQWQALAEQQSIRSQVWINGEHTDAINGETFDCISSMNRIHRIAPETHP